MTLESQGHVQAPKPAPCWQALPWVSGAQAPGGDLEMQVCAWRSGVLYSGSPGKPRRGISWTSRLPSYG